MKKQILLIVLTYFWLAPLLAFSQVISKSSQGTVANATCPGIGIQYEVSLPNGFGACQINWTITNGQKQSQSGNTVTILWDDTPGAKGKVEASFSNCGTGNEGNDGKTATPFEELILSVNNQSFNGAANNTVSIDYCTTKSVQLTVQPMYVQGTGGTSSIPLQEVVYDWTLPVGWASDNGNNFTTVPSIFIHPTACAQLGTVQVKGTIADRCGSSAESAAVSFNLSGVHPAVSITVPQGYFGSTACNTTPVTLTAYVNPNVGCVSGYSWQYPSGWTLTSQSGNTATFTPSGTPADSDPNNPFKVTVNYSCGSSITSGGYNPSWTPPTISGPNLVCSSGTNFSVLNVSSQALPITWSSSNTGVVYFPNPTSTTVNNTVNLVAYANGSATLIATTNCNVATAPKVVFNGLPSFTSSTPILGPSQITEGYSANYSMYDNNGNKQVSGETSYSWSVQSNWSIFGTPTELTCEVIANAPAATKILKFTASNSCGSVTVTKSIQSITPGSGGCNDVAIQTYPNPSKAGDVTIDILPPGGGGGGCTTVDDVASTDATTTASTDRVATTVVAPNEGTAVDVAPATTTADESTVVLYNNMGQEVFRRNFSAENVRLSGLNLKTGIHIMYKGKKYQKKLVVE